MFEADALCDRIAIIAKGKIVAEGTPKALKANVADATVVEIETFGVADGALERLRAVVGVTAVTVEDREQAQVIAVQSPTGLEITHTLLAALGDTQIGRVSSREPTLEDAYVALVTDGEDEAQEAA
jgi:ABC-2 type transport system ATP-binding protein